MCRRFWVAGFAAMALLAALPAAAQDGLITLPSTHDAAETLHALLLCSRDELARDALLSSHVWSFQHGCLEALHEVPKRNAIFRHAIDDRDPTP